jgi:hypothetical protein
MRWKNDNGLYNVILGDLTLVELDEAAMKAVEPEFDPEQREAFLQQALDDMNRSIEQKNLQTESTRQLKQVVLACSRYAADHEGQLPDNIDVLIRDAGLSPDLLISPLAPQDYEGTHYIYLSGQTLSMPSDNIIVYENPDLSVDGNVVVGYLDGRVIPVSMLQLTMQLRKTAESLSEPLPEETQQLLLQ